MTPRARKISLAAAARHGHTWLTIYCETQRPEPERRYSHATNVCGHKAEMHISEAIARWGEDCSLSELPVFCSKCGGRNYDARTSWPR